MPIGSRAFLIKLGHEKPTGILGVGETRSDPYAGKHYTDPSKTANYVDVRWTDLRQVPLIGWAELQRPPFEGFRWGIQGSGVELPKEIAGALEQLWHERAGMEAPTLPEELPAGVRFVEGAQKMVMVNAYERDPGARAACLETHGYACAVCDVRLEDRYGEIARRFIHVHHVTPIAKIGKAYEVDAVKDLRPVCPNCHAILHREDPPLTIEAARELLSESEVRADGRGAASTAWPSSEWFSRNVVTRFSEEASRCPGGEFESGDTAEGSCSSRRLRLPAARRDPGQRRQRGPSRGGTPSASTQGRARCVSERTGCGQGLRARASCVSLSSS